MNLLNRAAQLKAELDDLRPLDGESEARIMQKFRLDWNYHSNNLEGNSLTYGETKDLILFSLTVQGKPLKDHFEIAGHNATINWILEVVKNETTLIKVSIRQFHTLLLKTPDKLGRIFLNRFRSAKIRCSTLLSLLGWFVIRRRMSS